MVRFKNRYALCEIVSPGRNILPKDLTSSQLYHAVKAAVLDTHGDFGLASLKSSLNVKYLNLDTNIAIIRGERRFFPLLASSLVFVNKVSSHPIILKTFHVGGSIRACQKALIRYHIKNMTRLFPHCTTNAERAEVIQSLQDACQNLETGRRDTSGRSTKNVQEESAS